MPTTSPQRELFARPIASPGTVFVNDRVCVQTEEEQRVVFVHGIIFSHYAIEDRTAEAYAMVTLFESGYADQNDIARCFGYSARSLSRSSTRRQVLPSPISSRSPSSLKGRGWSVSVNSGARLPST